jgi:hypothetical protein
VEFAGPQLLRTKANNSPKEKKPFLYISIPFKRGIRIFALIN